MCRCVGMSKDVDKPPTTATLLRDGQMSALYCIVSFSENWMENPGVKFVVGAILHYTTI